MELRPGETKRRYFVVIVPDRSLEMLKEAILTYIKKGSHVTSDCWKAYGWMDDEDSGYQYDTVNHSKHFKDPETGAHTNIIEGKWNGLKSQVQ